MLEVPSKEPIIVPRESAKRALFPLFRLPSSSIIPVLLATPTKVPIVSNRSTKNKEKIAANKEKFRAPKISSLKKPGAIDGGASKIPKAPGWKFVIIVPSPAGTNRPTIVVIIIPRIILPVTLRTNKIPVIIRPKIASKTLGSVILPKASVVAGFATTMPAFKRPIKAINKPIPALVAALSGAGIALIIVSLSLVKVTIRARIRK